MNVAEFERHLSGGKSVDVPTRDVRFAKMACVVEDVGTEDRWHDAIVRL